MVDGKRPADYLDLLAVKRGNARQRDYGDHRIRKYLRLQCVPNGHHHAIPFQLYLDKFSWSGIRIYGN